MHDGYFWVGKEKVPPLSGEFEFWRNTKLYWPRILGSIKDLGFRHIATYVHWCFHQLSPDTTPPGKIQYDFTGETDQQRNLAGYLDIIDKSEFWLNIRPGPYIYAETEFSGVTGRADKLHRNHPEFLALAEDYLKAVCKVIKPHLVTNGGRVFLCQVDNEVSTIRHLEQVLEGPVDQLGSWASFLKQKYGEVSTFNEIYGTKYNTWEEVEPVLRPAHAREFPRFQDAAEFLEWYDALFFGRIAKIYRDNGIDVPLYVNSTGFPFPHDPARLRGTIDLLTTDLYYHKTDTLINMLSLNAKYLRTHQSIVMAGEFRSGGGGGEFTPEEYLYQGLLWMGYGFHGVNYFMLVERQRWPHTPIDFEGRPMDPRLYGAFKRIALAYNDLECPSFTLQDLNQVSLIWSRRHAFSEKVTPMEPVFRMDPDHPNNFTFKELLRANICFDLHYPDEGGKSLPKPGQKVVIYAGPNFYPLNQAETLLKFLHAGGKVVFMGGYPVKTEIGDPLQLFSDLLPAIRGIIKISEQAVVQYGTQMFTATSHFLVDYDLGSHHEAQPFIYKHAVVGYSLQVGKGTVWVLGFDVTRDLWAKILPLMGITPLLNVAPGGILATLQARGTPPKELLLTAINPSTEKVTATVKIVAEMLGIPTEGWHATDYIAEQKRKTIELKDMGKIELVLPARGGALLLLQR